MLSVIITALHLRPQVSVDQQSLGLCLLNYSLDRSGVGRDNGNKLVKADKISESYVNKLHELTLLNILDLLADLFDLAFDLNHLVSKLRVLYL